ncbi:MAG: class I SAM-dependent methyltransferase [Nanoarchaeota archaeon]
MKKEGFDVRIVSYEYIHSINPSDFKALVKAVNPKPNENILDAFCGYGAVGKTILAKEKKANLYFEDESEVQLKRAIKNITEIPKNRFISTKFPKTGFTQEFFDKIVIKMGIHEVSKKIQYEVAKEVNRVLKKNGKFIVWDIMLSKKNQKLFQDVLRKKDELAGFNILTRERYFFREDEFIDAMKKGGFSHIKEYRKITYRFSSNKRLHQELKGDIKRLNKLNDFIRKVFPEKLKKEMKYKDSGEDIQFNIVKKIYVMTKK